MTQLQKDESIQAFRKEFTQRFHPDNFKGLYSWLHVQTENKALVKKLRRKYVENIMK